MGKVVSLEVKRGSGKWAGDFSFLNKRKVERYIQLGLFLHPTRECYYQGYYRIRVMTSRLHWKIHEDGTVSNLVDIHFPVCVGNNQTEPIGGVQLIDDETLKPMFYKEFRRGVYVGPGVTPQFAPGALRLGFQNNVFMREWFKGFQR